MTGSHIPPSYPLAPHPFEYTLEASSHFPREESISSLLSSEAGDSSIRIVKPKLTLSPQLKSKNKGSEKDATDSLPPDQVGNNQLADM